MEQQAPVHDAVPTRPGSDVFISYSRRDREVVERLASALQNRGRTAWVDWADIPPTAEWMAEITSAIDASDTIVVVLSPDSIASPVCTEELEAAVDANKRIVPVVVRDVAAADVPHELSKRNWLFLRGSDDFDQGVDRLIETLDTDLEATRFHTGLLVKAREWEHAGQPKSRLLRGSDLGEAESYVASPGKGPTATQEQTRFVLASRKAASRRQRGAIAITTVVALVAATLGVFAWNQRSAAIENERLAVARARESRSRELAAASISQLSVDPELSLLLATESMRNAQTPEALAAIRQALTESKVRMTLTGHEGPVATVAYAPDGGSLLSASYDGTARLWDPTESLTLAGHTDLIESATFSPDGSVVATASFDGTARTWDAANGAAIAVLTGHEGAVHDAVFSPDGRLLATAGEDGAARLWHVPDGERSLVLRGHHRPIYDVAFSPDGTTVATASDDDTARLRNAETGELIAVLRGHADGLYSVAFGPDGTELVTASQDGTARVWNAETGAQEEVLEGRQPLAGAVFDPNGSLILTFGDENARIWDAASGRQLAVLRGHQASVASGSFSSDGSLVLTASMDGTARVWDARSGENLAVLRGHAGQVLAAAFSPLGTGVATGSEDATVRLWDPISGRVVFEGDISGVFGDPAGPRIAVATWDGSIHIIGSEQGDEQATIDVGAGAPFASFNDDGSLIASGATDGIVRAWDPATGSLVHELRGHERVWVGAGFFDQGEYILSWSDDGTARLWDPTSGEQVQVFEHGDPSAGGAIWEGHLSLDGTRVLTTGIGDGVIRVWDATNGEELWSVDGLFRTGGIGAAISPDGRLAASVSGETTIWDVESGHQLATLEDPGGIHGVGFAPDSRTIVSRSDDGAARIWNARTGELLTEMGGHPSAVNSAWFSGDGRWVVTTADDGRARVFVARSGELVATYGGGGGRGLFAFFSSDDQSVVSYTEHGVRIDRCDTCGTIAELESLASTRATRLLTDDERVEFLGRVEERTVAPPPRAGLTDGSSKPVPDGLVHAGDYCIVGANPEVCFTLQDDWLLTTFLDLAREGEQELGVLVQLQGVDNPNDAVVFAVLLPGRVIDRGKDWDERRNILPFPTDFPSWLASDPNLRTEPATRVSIDGREGLSTITRVVSVPGNSWPNCGGSGCVTPLAYTLANETGPITDSDGINVLSPGETDRWIVVPTEVGTILINAFSSTPRGFAALEPLVDGVLATVTIGED